jgi:hypothetical protein
MVQKSKKSGSGSGGRRARPRRAWVRYADARLLDQRLRDLDLRIERTWLESCLERVYAELEEREIRFRPHAWLSSEWFSPDGIPGIAIPFYLAHPRLIRLERKQMLEVEGGSEAECMRILRHEAGHALDTAYRLHFKPEWRKTFGRYSQPYPDYYRPKPNSRSYVLHLDSWYAQAHPAEDFAETFAVWLTPRSRWRRRYQEWPTALRKLRFVDAVMREHVAGQPPRVVSRTRVDPANRSSMTLREFYQKKRARYGVRGNQQYDRDLKRIFSSEPRYAHRPTGASVLRAMRREIRTTVAEWTGAPIYTIDQVLQDMIDRCRELKLRVAVPASKLKIQATLLSTVQTMNCLHVGRYEIPL